MPWDFACQWWPQLRASAPDAADPGNLEFPIQEHEKAPPCTGAVNRGPGEAKDSRGLPTNRHKRPAPALLHSRASPSLYRRSAKATILSWLSKYGICEEARSVLGHHALPSRSVVTYSRDLLAAPLRHLASVLKAVENGSFRHKVGHSQTTRPFLRKMPLIMMPMKLARLWSPPRAMRSSPTVRRHPVTRMRVRPAHPPLTSRRAVRSRTQGNRWMDPASCHPLVPPRQQRAQVCVWQDQDIRP